MCDADIYQAFDHCTVPNVHKGLVHAAIPAYLQHAFLDPLCHSVGTVSYDGMDIPDISWDTCIRTGGPEGPLAFNLIVAAMWSDTIREWDRLGLGYRVEFVGASRHPLAVSHLFWADNCYVLARSREELTRMMRDLTIQLHSYGMRWKPTSLLYMVCGVPLSYEHSDDVPRSLDLVIDDLPIGIDRLRFRRVLSINVLGCEISFDHNTAVHEDLDYRISLANRAFYAQASYFRSPSVPLKNKYRRYMERVQPLVLYCSEGTTIDQHSLARLHTFEGRCLRFMLRFLRKPDESEADFQKRRYDTAREKFHMAGFASIVQRYLRILWNFATDAAEFANTLEADAEQALEADRSWRDARWCAMAFGPYWDAIRTKESEAWRFAGKWRECGKLKRHRSGGQNVGQRSWQYIFSEFLGFRWWEGFRGDVHAHMQFATHVCTKSMLQYFITRSTFGCTSSPVYVAPSEELQVTPDNTPEGLERLSKRIALHNMKSTKWDLVSGGVPLEVVGDSLLIVNWLCGRWRVEGKHYADRVARAINTLDGLCSFFGARPAAAGYDIFKHDFREWNTKADILTHQAREGHIIHHECSLFHHQYETEFYTPAAVRAGFDGGVCELGSGCGAWVQVGLRPRYWDRGSQEQLIWKDVFISAFCLPAGSTVTDTELSAAEQIIELLPRIFSAYFNI